MTEKHEAARKRVKMRDLESVLRCEGNLVPSLFAMHLFFEFSGEMRIQI